MSEIAATLFFAATLLFGFYAIRDYKIKPWGYTKTSLTLMIISFIAFLMQAHP